jgi:hypothetical protein
MPIGSASVERRKKNYASRKPLRRQWATCREPEAIEWSPSSVGLRRASRLMKYSHLFGIVTGTRLCSST